MLALVPRTGRVLEVGCGHGLCAAALALESHEREVVGVDVDGAKIEAARRAALHHAAGNVRFEARPPGELPDGPWDAVVIVDVLYLIDRAGEAALLRRLAGDLAPGGVIVVKEMATTPRWKFALMRAQERLAVQVLHVTAGDALTFVSPDDIAAWLTASGLTAARVERIDRLYPHPHALVTARKPGA